MLVHNLIAAAVLIAVCAAVGYMTSPGPVARRRTARAAARAWRDGLDITAGLAQLTGEHPVVVQLPDWRTAPVVPDDWRCPTCGIWRCRDGRAGKDCGGRDQPTAFWQPPKAGRHDLRQAAARWLAGDWWDSPLPAELRLSLGRMVGAERAPVQMAGPVGWLP